MLTRNNGRISANGGHSSTWKSFGPSKVVGATHDHSTSLPGEAFVNAQISLKDSRVRDVLHEEDLPTRSHQATVEDMPSSSLSKFRPSNSLLRSLPNLHSENAATEADGLHAWPAETCDPQTDRPDADMCLSSERTLSEEDTAEGCSLREQNVSSIHVITQKIQVPEVKEIALLEGRKGALPTYLWALLAASCALEKTQMPTCVKKRWDRQCTLTSYDGREARFVVSDTNEPLEATRMSYGNEHQFIFVTPKSESTFNDGKAAIISNQNKIWEVKRSSDGGTRTPWFVWTPFKLWRTDCVDRVIDPPSQTTAQSLRCDVKKAGASAHREHPSHSPAQIAASTSISPLIPKVSDPQSAVAPVSGNPMAVIDDLGCTKRRIQFVDSSESDVPITRKRRHMRAGIKAGHRSPKPALEENRLVGGRDGNGETLGSHSTPKHLVPQSAFNARLPVQTLKAQGINDKLGNVVFIFMKSGDDLHPRVKSYRDCNTFRKFSCQATAHGITVDEAPCLLLKSSNLEPRYIMRSDQDDFSDFIRKLESQNIDGRIEVMVSPISD